MKISRKIFFFLIALLFVFPFFYMLMLSFTRSWIYPALIPSHIDLQNWKEMINGSSGLLHGFFISLIIGLFVAFLSTLTGFVVSRSIALNKNRKAFMIICYFPFVLSPVIYALLLNHFFIQLGLSATVAGVILAQLLIALPFSIILFNSFWGNRIFLMEEISYTLGSTFSQMFFKILIPVAKPQLMICFFQTFLISWFEYGLTSLIGLGQVQTLTIKVYQYIGEANMFYAALSSCIIILPPVLLLWLNKKFVFNTLR